MFVDDSAVDGVQVYEPGVPLAVSVTLVPAVIVTSALTLSVFGTTIIVFWTESVEFELLTINLTEYVPGEGKHTGEGFFTALTEGVAFGKVHCQAVTDPVLISVKPMQSPWQMTVSLLK
jgi:hypothetical protein